MNNEQLTNDKNKLARHIALGIVGLLFIFILVGLFPLFRTYGQIISFPQTSIFLKNDLTNEEKQVIENRLSKTREINFKFISQEEALQFYQGFHQEDELLLKLIKAEMLPAVIELHSNNQQSLNKAVEIIRQEVEVEEIREQTVLVNQLNQRLKLIIGVVGGSLVLLLGLLLSLRQLCIQIDPLKVK